MDVKLISNNLQCYNLKVIHFVNVM